MATSEEDLGYRFLEYVYDNDKGLSGPAELGGLWDLIGEEQSHLVASSLRGGNFITDDASMGGGYHITSLGRQSVEELRARRKDRARRRKHCRAMLLRWLDERDANDAASRAVRKDFDAALDLLPFTETESEQAAKYLRDSGLIESINAGEADHILLWLTEDGRECIDSGLSVEDFVDRRRRPSSHSQTIHVQGSGNTVSGAVGDSATSAVTVKNSDPATVRLLIDAIRQVAGVLALPREAEELLAEIEQTDDPTLIQRGLGRVYLLLNDTSTGAAGGLIAAWMAHHFGIA